MQVTLKLLRRYDNDELALLYVLLAEREPEENISHRSMPTYSEHVAYIHYSPHTYYIIEVDGKNVGVLYVTTMYEIGVSVLKRCRREGIAKAAIDQLMKENPDVEYLANINPRNEKSIKLFTDLGFNLIQQTYRLTKS